MEIVKKALSVVVLVVFISVLVSALSLFFIKPLFGTAGLVAIIILLVLIVIYQWSKEEDQP